MPRFFGRIALWTTLFAFLVAGAPTAAHAAAKRKAKAKAAQRKKPVAAERLVPAIKRGQPNVQARASLVIDEAGAPVFAHNPDARAPDRIDLEAGGDAGGDGQGARAGGAVDHQQDRRRGRRRAARSRGCWRG